LTGQPRPRDTVHGQAVSVQVEERRRRIELDQPPRRAVARSREAVCPRVQQRDSRRAALRGGGVEVVDAPQEFFAAVPKRYPEHPVRGDESRLQVTSGDVHGGRIGGYGRDRGVFSHQRDVLSGYIPYATLLESRCWMDEGTTGRTLCDSGLADPRAMRSLTGPPASHQLSDSTRPG